MSAGHVGMFFSMDPRGIFWWKTLSSRVKVQPSYSNMKCKESSILELKMLTKRVIFEKFSRFVSLFQFKCLKAKDTL